MTKPVPDHFGLTPLRTEDPEKLPYSRAIEFSLGLEKEAFRIPPPNYSQFAAEAVSVYCALLLKEFGKDTLRDMFTTCVDYCVNNMGETREGAYNFFKIKRANTVEASTELYFFEKQTPLSRRIDDPLAKKGHPREEWTLEKTISHTLRLGREKISLEQELETPFSQYWEMVSSALDMLLPTRALDRLPHLGLGSVEATGIIKNFNGLEQTYRVFTLPFIEPFQITLKADTSSSEGKAWPPNFVSHIKMEMGTSFLSTSFVDEIASSGLEIIKKTYDKAMIREVFYKGLVI